MEPPSALRDTPFITSSQSSVVPCMCRTEVPINTDMPPCSGADVLVVATGANPAGAPASADDSCRGDVVLAALLPCMVCAAPLTPSIANPPLKSVADMPADADGCVASVPARVECIMFAVAGLVEVRWASENAPGGSTACPAWRWFCRVFSCGADAAETGEAWPTPLDSDPDNVRPILHAHPLQFAEVFSTTIASEIQSGTALVLAYACGACKLSIHAPERGAPDAHL